MLPIKGFSNVTVLNPHLLKGRGGYDDLRAGSLQRIDGDFTGFSDLKADLEKCLASLTALSSSATLDQALEVNQRCKAALLESLKLNPSTRNRVLATFLPILKERFPDTSAVQGGGSQTNADTLALRQRSRPTWRLIAEELKTALPRGQRSQILSDFLPKPSTQAPQSHRWQSLSFGTGRERSS